MKNVYMNLGILEVNFCGYIITEVACNLKAW